MKTRFLFLFYILFLLSCSQKKEDFINEVRPSAVPLITVNPYFSIWSFNDHLNEDFTRHWTGLPHPLNAYLKVDGEVYRIMGKEETESVVVVPTSQEEEWNATYKIMPEDGVPGNKWYEESYDDSSWNKGKGAYGNFAQNHWEGVTDIYIRRDIELDSSMIRKGLSLKYMFDEDIKIYINDTFALLTEGFSDGYDVIELTDRQLSYLKPGHNFIACHCLNRNGNCAFDFGLVMSSNEKKNIQKSLNVLPTRTIYNFECGPVELELTFTAPLLLSDIELMSRPVNYISYEVKSKDGLDHDVQFLFTASPKLTVDYLPEPIIFQSGQGDDLKYARMGTISQRYLAKKGDNLRIDWGYFYLASNTGEVFLADSKSMAQPINVDSIQVENFEETPILLTLLQNVQMGEKNFLMVAYDEVFTMQYFWANLRPYWNRLGNETILGQIKKAADEYASIQNRCQHFDNELMNEAMNTGGKKYAELCALAYRQSIAAHAIAESPNGELLFLSKECYSNGSMGTVDVSYPSSPLFLLYNPEFVKGMMNPVFYISESGRINKPFAVHDVGIYPIANGCQYGDGMPVEESANMLIMTYGVALSEGNADYARKHWNTLTKWADYLMQYGADPAEQLCTDDFGGHLAHNSNLAVKAIIAIAAYGKLSMMLGYNDGEKYFSSAEQMAKEWEKRANDGDHYRLAFDLSGSWSQKYNLVWDKVFGFNIFDKSISRKEVAYYLSKQNEYGMPLDMRKQWTKTDWIVWSAALSDNLSDFQTLTDKIWKYQNETSSRVPMSDFIFSDKPICVDFRARSVVGAYFIKMLEDKYRKNSLQQTN